jgi:putative oxidoreductase
VPRLKTCLWAVATGYAAVIMIVGGGAKLAGYPMAHISFAAMSLPVWFGYFIGACELIGGVALFVNRTRRLAAIGLAIIMAGALYFHTAYTPLIMGLPALMVFVACIYIAVAPKRPAAA